MGDNEIWEDEAYEEENYVMLFLKFDSDSVTLKVTSRRVSAANPTRSGRSEKGGNGSSISAQATRNTRTVRFPIR